MIDTEIDYLDGEFTVVESVPATIEELKSQIGEQAIIDEATGNLYYRNKYPRVYKAVSKAVAEAGFARAVKETKTNAKGTTKDILISEMEHLRAYLATGEDARTKLQELFTKVGTSEPLYVKGERVGGGGKVSQKALDNATKILDKGDEAVDEAVSKLESSVPGLKVGRDSDGRPTHDGLARAIQQYAKHLQKKAELEAAAGLGV